MPQPNKIPLPFAASGDKNTIPENTETTGLASWRDGFPAITSAPFSEGGVAPKRADFNGIFNALSLATLWQQQGGFYAYDNTTDYEVGNVVEYNNDLYKCITANGPGSAVKDPTDATVWSKVMTAADAAALYLPLSGGTMTGTIEKSSGYVIKSTGTNNYLAILGGTGGTATDGAQVIVHGPDHAESGAFILHAGNSNGYKRLIGKPDSTLTWDGKDVITSTATGSSWLVCKVPTGWLCESTTQSLTVNSSGLVTVTFTQAFVGDQPQIAILGRSSAHIYRIQGLSLTAVTLQVYNMNGSTVTSGTTQFCLTAVGRWS